MTQPTLWSAGAREPAVTDLEGLLAGPGHIVKRGDSARIGIIVTPERADRLARLLDLELGMQVELTDVDSGSGIAVRTPWLAALLPVAAAWQRGSSIVPPPGRQLDGARLRWWLVAAGRRSDAAYTLPLAATSEGAWPGVGAALSYAGVAGVLVGPRAGGPAYRVVGQRRLSRLRELVGDPPAGVPEGDWPPSSGHEPTRHVTGRGTL